jgi:hypothetical protein
VVKNDAESPAAPGLFHPVYLDVPMMISFLAALRDGVAFEDTMTRRDSQSTSRERDASARVRLPSLGSLLGFDASGRMASSHQGETSEEVMAVRRHTEASLFNALYAALTEDGVLRDVSEPADLAHIAPGNVIELSGDFIGNPLESVVAFGERSGFTDQRMVPLRELSRLRASATLVDGRALDQLALEAIAVLRQVGTINPQGRAHAGGDSLLTIGQRRSAWANSALRIVPIAGSSALADLKSTLGSKSNQTRLSRRRCRHQPASIARVCPLRSGDGYPSR